MFDATHNVNDDSSLHTTVFNTSLPLFDAHTPESGAGESGTLSLAKIHANVEGDDYDNLNDEYLVFTNAGNDALDLTRWTLHDEAGHAYAFPAGFTLSAGESATVHTGSGTNSETDLYWDASSPVWNNTGDTATVEDANGNTIVTRDY